MKTKVLRVALRIFPRAFITSFSDGLLFYFGPPETLFLEPYSIKLFKQSLRPGATVLDIGAHRGYYTLIATKGVGDKGRVYAFEPSPENLWLLRRNVELNGFSNVHIIGKAVSNQERKAVLYYGKDSGSNSLFPNSHVFKDSKAAVECISIDNYLKEDIVDVIKIDIEGGELDALRGMQETLSKSKSLVMLCEFNPKLLREAGVDTAELLGFLKNMGFEISVVDEDCYRLLPTEHLKIDQIVEIAENSRYGYVNLYCRKQETG